MKNHLEEIARLLNKNEPVIFYTVSSGTFENIRALKKQYNLEPTAVCDGDKKKQGRTYRGLEGLSVLSPEDAAGKYPQAHWYIPSLDYRFQIIAFLTETMGVLASRIINYTPVRKVRSCKFLQKALIYDRTGDLRFCWRNPCPSISFSEEINGKELVELRGGLLERIQQGDTSPCAKCPQICEDYYPVDNKAWSINYFCNSRCNYKCSYCTIANAPEIETDHGRHTLGEVISAFKEEDILDPDYSVILSTAGEPLLHPKRKEFYQAFDGAELDINTNASIYDPDLFDLMMQKPVLLCSSIDAGTKETYRQIKGVDSFIRVRENLTKYAQASVGIVALKYLFVPGVNDNDADIEGFVRLCMETGATFVIVSVDYFSISKITEQTKASVQKLRAELSAEDILCVPYTAWETAEYEKMMRDLFQ